MEEITFYSEGLEVHGVLHETVQDQSRAVIFCHGAFDNQENWFPYAQRMNADGLAAFTFDFAGHGKSAGVSSLVNLQTWAYNIRDGISCLEQRGFNQFGLVGWGSGGSSALLAAAHDPRLACAAVLAGPVFLMPPLSERLAYGVVGLAARLKMAIKKKPIILSRLNELAEMRFLTDEADNQRYISDPRLRESYRAVPVPESLDSIWFDITRTVAKIQIPVLVIHGAQDQVIEIKQSQNLYNLLQAPKSLKLIAGSGHALHYDQQAEEVYKLIAVWMKRHLKV